MEFERQPMWELKTARCCHGNGGLIFSTCPGCGKVGIEEFRDSTAEEVERLGFKPEEYR